MGLFNKNPNEAAFAGGKKNWADVIKNTSTASYLLWKQPEEDFNNNSTLIVDPGEMAIFIKDGHIEDVFEKGKYQLDSENYPFISRLRNAFTGGISTFNCKVYFVRTAQSMEVTWGGGAEVLDPEWGTRLEIKANGAYKVLVENPVILLEKMVGSRADLTQEGLNDYFRNNFQQRITDAIGDVVENSGEDVVKLSTKKRLISELASPILDEVIKAYGLKLEDLSVANLHISRDEEMERQRSTGAGMKVLGDNWQAAQARDIMKDLVNNQGMGGAAAGAGAGIGMGMAAAGGMFGMMNPMMNQMQQPQQQQQQQQQQQPAQQPAAAAGPVEKIKQLKEMLDLGVLTQEEFDAKKAEILSSM